MTTFMKFPAVVLGLFITVLISGQEWHTDMDEAMDLASKENKTIILVFQGSDWCAPCMKLEREIWTSDTFKAWAKAHYIMVKADFPRKRNNALPEEQKKKNEQLAEKYNKQGFFPFVVILDKDGHVLGETGYKKMTTDEYIKHLESFRS